MSDVSSLAWFGMTRGQLVGQLRQMASELEVPMASATEPTTYIEQWAVVTCRNDPCAKPVRDTVFAARPYLGCPERYSLSTRYRQQRAAR